MNLFLLSLPVVSSAAVQTKPKVLYTSQVSQNSHSTVETQNHRTTLPVPNKGVSDVKPPVRVRLVPRIPPKKKHSEKAMPDFRLPMPFDDLRLARPWDK